MFHRCCRWCDLFFFMCTCSCVVLDLSVGALPRAECGAAEAVEALGAASAQLAPRWSPQRRLELTPRSTMRNRSPHRSLLHPRAHKAVSLQDRGHSILPVSQHTHTLQVQPGQVDTLCVCKSWAPALKGSWESVFVHFDEDSTPI